MNPARTDHSNGAAISRSLDTLPAMPPAKPSAIVVLSPEGEMFAKGRLKLSWNAWHPE